MGERVGQITKVPEVKKSSSNSRVRRTKRLQSMDTPADHILFLQRTAGNQAVSKLMRSGALQAKLRVGQPGDMYEQEADRVADAVMRMPEQGVQRQVEPEEEEEETLQSKPLANQITPLVQVQRQEEPEEEEETLQAKPLAEEITPLVQRQVEPEEEEEEMLQAKSREDATSEVTNDLESQINAIHGGGRPLAESERAYFEPRFGADFDPVRVHTDARAAESARAVNARAFTVGQDVVFGAGQHAPGTSEGRKLMAHELTHVVQQIDGKKALTVCNTSILMRQTEVKKAGSAKTKAKGEKIVEDIKLKRKIAAIVLAESYPGQEKDIVWIYYNQWKSLGEKGLKRSVAYKKKGMWYKVYMIALGDKTFENDKGTKGHPKKYKNLSEYVKKHNWFKKYRQKKVDKIMKLVEEVFENPGKNPYKGWLGQGNLTDFNRNDGKWKKARRYFYLQNQKKVKKIFVKELPADKAENYSFIFDENKINDYFKKNPGMLPDFVKKYEP